MLHQWLTTAAAAFVVWKAHRWLQSTTITVTVNHPSDPSDSSNQWTSEADAEWITFASQVFEDHEWSIDDIDDGRPT